MQPNQALVEGSRAGVDQQREDKKKADVTPM
jgi:hypothetical protein